MNRLNHGRAVLIALIAPLAGCGGTGGISVADEQRAGAQAARQVEEQVGTYTGEFVATYVDTVGRRLVARLDATPYYFKFRVIDQAEPNAFATPGGFVFISRGLLALINSEDELAGILAHEISHVSRRHHARQAQRGVLPSVLTAPGRAIGAVVGADVGKVINAPIAAAGEAWLSSYGRMQESEADELGMRLAASAGYDPAGLAGALLNVERGATMMTGQQRRFSFFDSHPTTPTRVEDLEKAAQDLQWQRTPPVARSQDSFYKRLDGLTWGPDNPLQGVFRRQQFMQPDMDLSITFPDGWRTLNTPRFVGAFAPADEAIILFGGPNRPGDARTLAADFVADIARAANVEPWEPVEIRIGEAPAWVVRLDDDSGQEPVSVYYVWISMRGTVFRIAAIGPEQHVEAMQRAALSVRGLTDEERRAIVAQHIRIATAETGETIADLSARTGNVISTELTAAINGRSTHAPLAAGDLVKIVREEAYFGNQDAAGTRSSR